MKDKVTTLNNLARYKSWLDIILQLIQLDYKAKTECEYYPNAIRDNDGNWYDAVQIGNQVWLAQNLKTTKDASGNSITYGDSNQSDITPYYYHVNGSDANDTEYGLMYNISAAQAACFSGWKLPTITDIDELKEYMGQFEKYLATNNPASIAKALADTSTWDESQTIGAVGFVPAQNNITAFAAKAAGYRLDNNYLQMGQYAMFWASTADGAARTYSAVLGYNSIELRTPSWYNESAMSVRYLYDGTAENFRKWYIAQYGSVQHILIDKAVEIEYVQVSAVTSQGYKLTKSPTEIKTMLANGKRVIIVRNDIIYTMTSGSPTAQTIVFISLYRSSNKPIMETMWYNGDNGINTVWKVNNCTLQEELTIKTVNGNSLVGNGNVNTEIWSRYAIADLTSQYEIVINNHATVENIIIDNTGNTVDLVVNFDTTGLDYLYAQSDTIQAGMSKVFRVKKFTVNNKNIGVITENEMKTFEY